MPKLRVTIGVILLAIMTTSCMPNYSNGDRIAVVTKLSEKGMIWKSWEGEALVVVPGQVSTAIQPQILRFNVDPKAVAAVQIALESGQRVKLVYRQWAMAPPTIDHDHVVTAVIPLGE